MKQSRREFVVTSLAGVTAVCVGQRAAYAAPENEDGYRLWLRYVALPPETAAAYRSTIRGLTVGGASTETATVIHAETRHALAGMLGEAPSANATETGGVLIGTIKAPPIRELGWERELTTLGPEGFIIRTTRVNGRQAIVVASIGDAGALYGTFHLLRLMQTAQPIAQLNISERPKIQLRMLNHWDNMDGTIERGYAGRSLWQWNDLPGKIDPRYVDYARANASLGINATAINSVNANAIIFTPEYLDKVAALATLWRPYALRVFLSANFASPIRIGGLKTADPLDQGVIDWWKAKAGEIYQRIPDFGGFLVKANSEGQPGPKDYKRNHAEGANCLADAVAPHGGNVIWRAFIYDEDVDPDRAKRAYIEFTKLDGQFRPNVLVQVKNGAIDFMPREPFHPLFGALNKTPVLAEIQATQEYLGQAKHLVYLGTMWEEFLDADTYAKGKGSTVGKVLEGQVIRQRVTGIASVLNPGLDRNWCGHHFSQSNWYASGRLAWNPELSARQIADEWTRMTFTNEPKTAATIVDLMMGSREAFVDYTMPLGLHHLIGGNHYAPMPQNAKAPRADWTATYYHQASPEGIGFDRSMKGNQAVGQYFPTVRDQFDNLRTCPEMFLLWFHRLPWDYKLKSGKTLWAGIVEKYQAGARQALAMQQTWNSLADKVDPQRHKEVADRLVIQVADAQKWRDEILQYFQQFSKQPIASTQESK